MLPHTPWASSYLFSFTAELFSLFVYSKTLPHMRCSSTNSLPPPRRPTPPPRGCFFIKLPRVALESYCVFSESAPMWLVLVTPNASHRKAPPKVRQCSRRLRHAGPFLPASSVSHSIYTHHLSADRQPVYLTFVAKRHVEYEIFNVSM